jgi:hypothetical protein
MQLRPRKKASSKPTKHANEIPQNKRDFLGDSLCIAR